MSLLNNRYEIVRPIKSGGFGEVYLAKDHNLGIDVALKRYHLEKMASKVGGHKMAQKYSVISEIRRAILFNHPNVARYFDAFSYEQDSTFGVEHYEIGVMEYLSEGDLGEFVQRNGIGSQKVKNALIGVLEGLEYLHSKQIIHRDIKENNILFDGEVPKIIDFGISKNADSNASGSTSVLFSTPGYLAPEQIEPTKYSVNGKVNHNIDFWAFGIMLYALIKKELPFGTNTDTEESKSAFRLRVLSQSIDEKNWTGIPEPYAKVIKLCLVKDANHRVKSAKELIPLIAGNETSGSTTLPDPQTTPPPLTQRSLRPTWLYYLIGGIALSVAVILGSRGCGGDKPDIPLVSGIVTDTTHVRQDSILQSQPKSGNEKTTNPTKAPSDKPYIKMISIPGRNFKLSETEVTIGQYLAFCKATDSHWPEWLEAGSKYNIHTGSDKEYSKYGMSENNLNHPITGVSALDADAFCRWMGGRLPTETEWEYAAKGGESYKFAGSDNIEAVAWYSENSGGKVHRVRDKSPNGYGLYDMSGNVWEWTSSKVGGGDRVSRGGCSYNDVSVVISDPNDLNPGVRNSCIGFRLAAGQ